MNEQEFRELSAAHAVDALSPDEEQSFSAALAAHPEWRTIVDADLATAAELGGAVPEVVPPPASRARLLDAIAELPQLPDERPSDPPAASAPARAPRAEATRTAAPAPAPALSSPASPTRRRGVGWLALAASVAVLLGLGLTPWARDSLFPQDPVTATLDRVEAAADARTATGDLPSAGRGTLHWSDSERRAVFVADGLPQAASGRDYELWIVRGERAISLGVVRPDGEHAAVIADGFRPGDTVAMTVEERGGSPSGAPTSAPILAIASS